MMMYLVINVVIIKYYHMYLLMQKGMTYMALLYHSPLRKDLQDLQEILHLISNL